MARRVRSCETDTVVVARYQLLTPQKPLPIGVHGGYGVDRRAWRGLLKKTRERRRRHSAVGYKVIVQHLEYAGVSQHANCGVVGLNKRSAERKTPRL